MRSVHRRSLGLLGVTVLFGCYDQAFVPGDDANERITITNDEFVLGQRVTYPDQDVPIDSASPGVSSTLAGMAAAPPALAPSSITLTLRAEATPPTVSGEVIQATSIWPTNNKKAVVSYNMRGSLALGGLDFFDKLDKTAPRLRSSATFTDSDISAISMDANFAYAAIASSDLTLPWPAVVERLQFQGDKFILDGNLRAQVTSFAATSTTVAGSTIYATSGDAGGVFALDANDMSLLGEYPLEDARWVAWDEDGGRIVVAQGTPGQLSIFEEGAFPAGSMNLLGQFPFPGADIAESKTTVEIAGGKAFIAAGPAGVQVVCLDDGQIVGSVPRPDPAALGLDSSVVVTNAVTVEDDLMFISNGEAGVYAAVGADSFETSACTAPQSITVLGQLQFDNLQSVNHVAYRNGDLFIAAGLGGMKMVEVDITR